MTSCISAGVLDPMTSYGIIMPRCTLYFHTGWDYDSDGVYNLLLKDFID